MCRYQSFKDGEVGVNFIVCKNKKHLCYSNVERKMYSLILELINPGNYFHQLINFIISEPA